MTERLSGSSSVADRVKRTLYELSELAVKAGRAPNDVKLMAVTKYVSPELACEAVMAGVKIIGENREQSLKEKLSGLPLDTAEIHFIGHLQTNKAKSVARMVECVQSLDSLKLAEVLNSVCSELPRHLKVFVEVNIGNDLNKTGVLPTKAYELIEALRGMKHLDVAGLMTILPLGLSSLENERYFSQMQELYVDIRGKNSDNVNIRELSMGMSSDYKEAVRQGSTLVRLGTALFG